MSPSRLAAWLRRRPPKATRLELAWEGIDGFATIHHWEARELDDAGGAGGEMPIIVAQEDCDDRAQRCRYELRWISASGKTLATKAIRCVPRETDDDDDDDEEKDGLIDTKHEPNVQGAFHQHMRFVETDRRMNNVALANIFRFYQDSLRDARAELKDLREENRQLRMKLRQRDEPETDVEAEARAQALNKFVEIGLPLLASHLHNMNVADKH
jgi:hypothetical protein